MPLLLAQAAPGTQTAQAPAAAPAPVSPPPADVAPPPADGVPVTGADGTPLPPQGQAQPQGFSPILLLAFGGLIFFMLFTSITAGRREKKKKAELLASLQKGSKVQTVGGILGTVVEVRDDELVIKVDENSNTRLRFAKSAVVTVLS